MAFNWTQESIDAEWVTGGGGKTYAANPSAVFELNGAQWDSLRVTSPRYLRGLSAAPDGSLFLSAGGISIWDGDTWTDTTWPGQCVPGAVYAFAVDKALAIDCQSRIYRWDGDTWQQEYAGPVSSIAATSSSNILTVGYRGTVSRYNGASWETLPPPISSFTLNAVCDAGSGFVVAGESSKTLAFDGANWDVLREAAVSEPWAVFAESASRMMLTTRFTTFKLADGTWSETPLPGREDAYSLGGRSLDDLYAGSDNGRLCHYDGHAWVVSDSLAGNQYAFWTSESGKVFSAGTETVYRLDGTWELIRSGEFELYVLSGRGNELVAGWTTGSIRLAARCHAL